MGVGAARCCVRPVYLAIAIAMAMAMAAAVAAAATAAATAMAKYTGRTQQRAAPTPTRPAIP